ncbi:MAG: hypothetical protein LBL97_00975 [Prevotellaceae bacterium]|jgi:hypothetical protein|nr:hypothetical protein [Prevotellaceae bacterium]
MKKLLPLIALLLFAACHDDEYHYPPVRLEFLTATTGSDGALHSVLTDNGQSFAVLEDASNTRTTPDTLLRIVSNYEQQTDNGVKLYAVAAAVAPLPRPAASFPEGVKRSPASVTSIWMGLNYLNILLDVKAQDKRHSFGFVEEENTLDPVAGTRTVRLSLYHDDNGDRQAYSQRAYLSIPLQSYLEAHTPTTIYFTATDYNGTPHSYRFSF